jgi:hypothetical protein
VYHRLYRNGKWGVRQNPSNIKHLFHISMHASTASLGEWDRWSEPPIFRSYIDDGTPDCDQSIIDHVWLNMMQHHFLPCSFLSCERKVRIGEPLHSQGEQRTWLWRRTCVEIVLSLQVFCGDPNSPILPSTTP